MPLNMPLEHAIALAIFEATPGLILKSRSKKAQRTATWAIYRNDILRELKNRHRVQLNMITKALVHEALDNSVENGYDMSQMTDMKVALDLIQYNSACENLDAAELAQHVKTWREKQK